MTQGSDPSPDPAQSPQAADGDPFQRLGLAIDATFDEVQNARQARLGEAGDDALARARVEAAYDAILMSRLRERQQGRVSTAARSASQREQVTPQPPPPRSGAGSLPKLPQLPVRGLSTPRFALPQLSLASGRERWFPLAAIGGLILLLLTLPQPPAELFVSMATLAALLNLQRRGGRFLPSLGWSLGLLCLGLLLGGLLSGTLMAAFPQGLPLSVVQIQSLPALLLLLLGALLIA